MDALSISGLHAWYGKAHILQGIDLTVPEGEVVSLFGRNGAGKTTLMKAVMRQVPRAEGAITLHGTRLDALATDARARAGIAYMSQEHRVFPDLTVLENCRVAGATVRAPRPMEEVLSLIGELRDHLHRPAGRLSGGQQQLVALARCMTLNCRMLMMDEPTEGVMPQLVDRIGEIIRGMAHERGMSVLLVEQNIRLGLSACTRACFIEKGRIVASGSREDVERQGMVEHYLGLRSAAGRA